MNLVSVSKVWFPLRASVLGEDENPLGFSRISVEFSDSSCYSCHSGCRHLVYLPPQNSARTAHTLMRQIKLSRPPPTHTHTPRSNRTDKRVREMYIGIKGILTELLTHLLYFILKVFLNNHGFITSPFTFIGMKLFFSQCSESDIKRKIQNIIYNAL